MKISIVGGDNRSINLSKLLLEDEEEIKLFGFDDLEEEGMKLEKDLEFTIKASDIIIGPLPCSKDNFYLNTPLYSKKIYIEDIFNMMDSDQVFIAGKLSKEILDIANRNNIKCIDLMLREEMAILNAIPTAEGAIQIGMRELDITLHGANILILGFGRIGKILAKMLKGIGGIVHVEARKYEDLAYIHAYDYIAVDLNELDSYIKDMNLIYNTVPSMIIGEERLQKMNKETTIIDLASIPGGVDFDKANKLGINAIWALGLPGKVAPLTAAKVMKDTIYNIIKEVGI